VLLQTLEDCYRQRGQAMAVGGRGAVLRDSSGGLEHYQIIILQENFIPKGIEQAQP
jgi:hypothetical protein